MPLDRVPRVRVGVRVLPHPALAGELLAIALASASIDWLSSHDTYAGLSPLAGPSWATERRGTEFLTRARCRRLFGRAGWKYST